MKSKLLYIISLCFLLVLNGCKESTSGVKGDIPSTEPHFLSVTDKDISLSARAQTFTDDIQANDLPWHLSGNTDWVKLSPESGEQSTTLYGTITENPRGDASRTNLFYVSSVDPKWGYHIPISLSQSANTPYINLDKIDVDFSGEGGTVSIGFHSNVTPKVSSDYYDWIHASLSNNDKSIIISVLDNNYGATRKGYVNVSYGNSVSNTITVTQRKPSMQAKTDTLEFDVTPSTYKLVVKSEASWKASTSDSWISVIPENHSYKDSILNVSVAANTSVYPRQGSVYLYIGNNKYYMIPVLQHGVFLTVDHDELNFNSGASKQNLLVRANTNWTAKSDQNWITVSPSTSEKTSQCEISVADNTSFSSREGMVTIATETGNIVRSISIKQNAKTFSVDTTAVNLPADASESTIHLTTDGYWTVTKNNNAHWFTITPTEGTGDADLVVKAEENTDTVGRMAYIKLQEYDQSTTIAIHQESKYLIVNSDSKDFTSKGGKNIVTINTNDNWSSQKSNNATWLSIDKTSGSRSGQLIVMAEDNPSTNIRSGYVDIKGKYTGTIRLNYEQAARYLTIDIVDFSFFAAGGTSPVATISTDGVFKITKEGNWFTIEKLSDNSFVVKTEKNLTDASREGKIVIELTDLKEGQIKLALPVHQLKQNLTFTKGDFTDDKRWDIYHNNKVNISVKGFVGDRSWNPSENSNAHVAVHGYSGDRDFGKDHTSNSHISNNGYGTDSGWYQTNHSHGSIGRNNFESDNKWDKINSHTDAGKNEYEDDSNWNSSDGGSHTIGRKGYGDDKNWNKK